MQARPSRSGGRFDFGRIKVIVRAGPTGWGPWARARLGVWGEELGQPLPFLGKAIMKKDDTEVVGGHVASSGHGQQPSKHPGDPARAKDSGSE